MDIVERFEHDPHDPYNMIRDPRDGEWVRFTDYESLRSELEAVKREAVEVLKPFEMAARNFESFNIKDPREWFAYGGVQDADGHHGGISVHDIRAARAFVEKHGRDE
jgi:hypothetical protein